MPDFVRTINLGKAVISVINIGDIYLPLAENMNVPEDKFTGGYDLLGLGEQKLIPIHCILIQLPESTVLVDAGVYDVETEPEYAIPNYTPPSSLIERLREMGVHLDSITQVVITHRHWDHFNGTTCESNGEFIPQFPRARYYLGRPDWERAEAKLQEATSIEHRTLRVLNEHGLLELVEGNLDLVQGIKIIAAPGETPGHQIVRVQSEGQTLFCMGDLYHHPIELAHPAWKVSWANGETISGSRQMLTQQALEEQALLIATHIPSIGRLNKTMTGVTWESVQIKGE